MIAIVLSPLTRIDTLRKTIRSPFYCERRRKDVGTSRCEVKSGPSRRFEAPKRRRGRQEGFLLSDFNNDPFVPTKTTKLKSVLKN